ncbi:LCP family protein [Actinoalloteichus hymeniacidonis]|uniref:Transcriptional attenuator, LytR family n=1 Tax=Actinoalloteichus hymeniacidonis TaxID=340345 RepID=A0AAC9HU35_9PSEU|nr:LCP family protein [Actinoalloteichus hymeniacidonis]AOS65468.1 transcriptional attenuator, LytR family [Actinoalloteichus hymeniacidonis]MBB5906445.1 LCP family protein required for cell wall assembly [Actinoalloteichus hymeniacidonis]
MEPTQPIARTPSAAAAVTAAEEPPRRSAGAKFAMRAAKTAVALVSVAVVSVTGYSWATYTAFDSGLVTSDVFGNRENGRTQGPNPLEDGMDLLLVGNDSRTDNQGNPLDADVLASLGASDDEGGDLTDTLIMVRIPPGGEQVSAVSFPRDSYVNVPGYGMNKINSAFGYGKRAAHDSLVAQGVTDEKQLHQESSDEGRQLLVQTLEELTGVTIDHYAEVNLLGFSEITEAVGGVEVCLLEPVDEYRSGAKFDAGKQTISGVDALRFVRQRYGLPNSDLDRVVRQQVFMAGLANKVLSADTLANPGKLSELINAVQSSVVLDSNFNIQTFLEHAQNIAGGNMDFQTIPVGAFIKDDVGQDVIQMDPAQVQQFMKELGGPPAEEPEPADNASEEASIVDPASITVEVYNAGGIPGLAAEVMAQLTSSGYLQGVTDNANPRVASVVRYATGEEANGQSVADALGGLIVEEDAALAPGTVDVILGEDYTTSVSNFAPLPGQETGTGTEGEAEKEQEITADGTVCVH